ncbi:MAG: alpha-glucan family phosphorylase [Deltaproteobacteria bacterium]|jgi:starch phosphorylase|nr:alpha-glucan family phosphorylase [Deltaproteobacteria bacterium]
MPESNPSVAYFSMEIALEPALPTYSGGLGVLAGDTLRSCADLGLEVCAVTLVHRGGYFRQRIGAHGAQEEAPDPWRPEERLEPLSPSVIVEIGGESVRVRAWLYRVVGERGAEVPVYLLDTDMPDNPDAARRLSDRLYGGDNAYRLGQEALLGVGGIRMLRALGHTRIKRYHLNEGHAALAIPELIDEDLRSGVAQDDADAADRVRGRCVFTTHTPVPAGHDHFDAGLVSSTLEEGLCRHLGELDSAGGLNMTELALEGSRFVNGVAMRHGEVSRGMFPGYPIRSITNGVHAPTWVAPPLSALFDRHVPHWRSNPFSLRCITAVSPAEIAAAHDEAKLLLVERVREQTGCFLRPDVLTLGFGRRATAYKRATLVLRDPARLERIARRVGPIQLVYGGKAHPSDEAGRRSIRQIHELADRMKGDVRIVFLPGYDMEVCGRLVAGCDVWLNTPVPPLEASGTSGMKAALNGVPSLSILDGWWVEGCQEGVTGWAIGRDGEDHHHMPAEQRDRLHAEALYDKLERVVAPCYYDAPDCLATIRRDAIALNGSHFNTHRMVLEYLFEAYRLDESQEAAG